MGSGTAPCEGARLVNLGPTKDASPDTIAAKRPIVRRPSYARFGGLLRVRVHLSLNRQPDLPHHLGPALGFVRHELAELGRGHRQRRAAELGDAAEHLRIA